MVFSIGTELCSHHHDRLPNIFIAPIRNLVITSSHFIFPLKSPRPRHPLTFVFCLFRFAILDMSPKLNHAVCRFFCDWFLSLSLMLSRFLTIVHVLVLHSFFLPNNILLYGYVTFYLSIHQVRDKWVVSTSWSL